MNIKGPGTNMRRRITVLALLFVLIGFGIVVIRLFYMQFFKHSFYVQQATMLQTRDSLITPNRGTIYDRNMQTLAESASTVKITVDPKAVIEGLENESEILAAQETIAQIVSKTLELDYDTILGKVQRTDTLYQVIATRVEAIEMDAVNEAIEAAECKGVYTEPDTKRYYQYGAYLSAVLGYVNSDNAGAAGLELEYEEELAGTAGRIVRAQNAKNESMPYEYEQYLPATDGNSIVTTIDSDIQSYLEKHLETALADNPQARDGVSGIVMDAKTGAILAMASMPDYDPNSERVILSEHYMNELRDKVTKILDEAGVSADISDDYYKYGGMENLPESLRTNEAMVDAIGEARVAQLNKMWRNPTVSDAYEPGSTFKLMNVATAYDLGLVNEASSFYCGGSLKVGDWSSPIKCWKSGGHGQLSLTEALEKSCNVAMMQIAFQTDQDRFYEYFKAFGLTATTGIDLPGEAKGEFFDIKDTNSWNVVSLAVSSFGQRFTVTPIQMASMVAAIVDDGKLKQPYLVSQVLNADGTIKSTTETNVVRQVISAETSAYMRGAMEEVVTNGTGKNAYVAGYRVGGKTATSELLKEAGDVEDRYTASFIGVAPMDDPQVVVIVAIQDLPESATHGGGAVAAPVVGRIMEDTLPYLGVIPSYSEDENDRREVSVPSLIGYSEQQAEAALSQSGLSYRIVGDGTTVTDQVPANGVKIPATGTIILYMGENKPTESVTVPDLVGLSPSECRERLSELGLYMKRKGVATSQTIEGTAATKQNPVAGSEVSIGSVITIDFQNSTDIGD